jgi:2-dehydropantoate 2-reductase
MDHQGREAWEIVGAGGIGCAVGYALARGGSPVRFVDCDQSKLDWGNKCGVQVTGLAPLPAQFINFRNWSPAPASRILLCTKCYDNQEVLERVPADRPILSIQNGFDASLEKRNEAVEAIASFVSECHAGRPETRLTRVGSLHIGGCGHGSSRDTTDARVLASALRSKGLFRVRVVDHVLPYKYSKLMYNAAISPLAAAGGLDNGSLLRVPTARRLFFALLEENYSILRHAGIALGKIGPFAPDTVQRILSRPWLARGLSWAFYPTLKGRYCSMSLDLPRGRTEVDSYNGFLLELAGDYPAILNRLTYNMIKRLEVARSIPSLTHLTELEHAYRSALASRCTRVA